jgi:protein-arginine kinase activator protein McsA
MAIAELQSLKDSLQEAIQEEAYEEAAKYRDQIQSFNDASESKNFTP